MKAFHVLGIATVVAVGSWVCWSTRSELPGREVKVKGGRTTIDFLPGTLKKDRLTVEFSKELPKDDCVSCSLPGFAIRDADLRFRIDNGRLAGFEGGKISHRGSFQLVGGKKSVAADEMTIRPDKSENGGLALTVDSPEGSFVAFELRRPRSLHRKGSRQLVLQDMDVVISDELADVLGDDELAGSTVGSVTLYAESEGAEDLELAEDAPPAAGLDVSLSAMGLLAVASNPTAKVGTYPNGRTGLTMSTTSCNVGTVNIPWNAPMQTTHPVIALNLYRVRNGQFEQVGWSWLKHGFLATNSNGCGTCQNPGTGSLLGLNCSDTYGTGNNGDRTYLGGRDEFNPFTGVWTCTNSWFSNYQNDCTRRNPGQVTLDAVDHRLDCLDSDLGNANSQYLYEAYYLTANDINTYNNIGSRDATFAWNGTSWTISTTTAMVQGPAINRWGEMRSTAQPQTEGDVIVAVQTTSLGGGMYHYEFAVYNHTLDRQVREFSVPMPYGATVQNIGFRDVDRDANNQWTATQNAHSLVWTSPTFGSANPNPLKYASVFNFRFDANVEPASSSATMALYKPGVLQSLAAATKGPLFLDPPASFSVINGSQRSGNLQSLTDADADRLVLGPIDSGARGGSGISTSSFAPAGTINQITLGIRSSNTLDTGGGAVQTVEAYNWNTSAYELLDTRPTTVGDSTTILKVTTNASRFVNGSTREVNLRIMHAAVAGSVSNRWTMAFDQIGTHFN